MTEYDKALRTEVLLWISDFVSRKDETSGTPRSESHDALQRALYLEQRNRPHHMWVDEMEKKCYPHFKLSESNRQVLRTQVRAQLGVI